MSKNIDWSSVAAVLRHKAKLRNETAERLEDNGETPRFVAAKTAQMVLENLADAIEDSLE